jgi:hypothetical protein
MASFELCFHELVHAMQPKEEVTIVWGTPEGDRTVHARRAPLGVHFKKHIPMVVSSVKPGSQAEEHGIRIDWVLKSVDGIDMNRMTSFKDGFKTLLHELKPLEEGKAEEKVLAAEDGAETEAKVQAERVFLRSPEHRAMTPCHQAMTDEGMDFDFAYNLSYGSVLMLNV